MRNDLHSLNAILEQLPGHQPPVEVPDARSPRPFSEAELFPTADDLSLSPEFSIRETFERRRSSLLYGDSPVDLKLVAGLVQRALRQDSQDWSLDLKIGPLEAFLFHRDPSGDVPGIVRVTTAQAEALGPLSLVGSLGNLGIQREFADAAGIIAIYGNLEWSERGAGAQGYRLLAVRAAMALYEIQLSLQSRGITGTLFGGYVGSAARTAIEADGVTRRALVAATYAHPPAAEGAG